MGHRKHSAPRHGSLAFLPRGRAASLLPRIRFWPEVEGGTPSLLGFIGYKAGTTHIITVDDRERTPNFGKALFNASAIISCPPLTVIGIRAYARGTSGLVTFSEAYAKELPSRLSGRVKIGVNQREGHLRRIEENLANLSELRAIVSSVPRDAGISQKMPFICEIEVGGGSLKDRLDFLVPLLGKEVECSDVFEPGDSIDVAGITKGKGFEGPVTRMGIKKKQHKSRKSVRAVGTLGPWHPASVMYTVPRAGQHGFHQRVEFNKRVLIVSNSEEAPITPRGGFPHFGVVKGPYVAVRGSVPGPQKRVLELRAPARPPRAKAQAPKILEIAAVAGAR